MAKSVRLNLGKTQLILMQDFFSSQVHNICQHIFYILDIVQYFLSIDEI